MNIDEAINKAADHIEQHPNLYDFSQGAVPYLPEHRACMLARIGQMAGMVRGINCDVVSRQILGMEASDFYNLIALSGSPGYSSDPAPVPAAMRKVATHYKGIPLGVRQIFRETVTYI